MATLLDFARQPTAEAAPAPAPQPQAEPAPDDPESFIAGQTYTLTGRDAYRADKRNGTWFLENLNRSWETPEARVFVGYVLKDDVMHWGEYVQDYQNQQASRWQVPLRPTSRRPADFRPCEIETVTIDMREW